MYRRTLYYVSQCKKLNSVAGLLNIGSPFVCQNIRRGFGKDKKGGTNISTLFVPGPIHSSPEDENVGAELVGTLHKADVLKVLNKFYQRPEVKHLCSDNGLDNYLQHQAYLSFRRYCVDNESLPVDLHIVINDILKNAGHITDIFPYFLRHAKQIFPHLDCMDDLKKISDLTSPPSWYPSARNKKRKIIFHAGPTNSGKTYHALEKFLTANSGVYCGPLKLLATEVFKKSNERGRPCDLVTGEERKYALGDGNPSTHVSCTVEMTNLSVPYEVAVIDEVQVMRDLSRGWAWTRAFLGLAADEIHICGEPAALDLISSLALTCNEQVEVRNYERLTSLTVESSALSTLDNVQPGDCIVCFSKNDIYTVSRGLEMRGKEAAVIYGGLPPGTKLAQAQKFNDPDSSCKYLVATDAIGMGLNLSIRRVIFYSMVKPTLTEKGDKEIDTISISQALQIAGRAGRFNTQYDHGFVTTFKPEDLPVLTKLLSQTPEVIEKAGLHPTAEQIELYAYHLPNASLSNLVSIFEGICTMDDSLYFMCNMDDFKFLADMVQHIPLPLRARYVFCCAPINRKMPFVCSMFVKFARLYSRNEAVLYRWLCRNIKTPFSVPKTINDLIHLETVYDVLDLYLWLSNRFLDLFPDVSDVRVLQTQLDETIEQGVAQITKLLQNQANIQAESDFNSKEQETEFSEEDRNDLPGGVRGRLTERLMAQGLLTQSMIRQLKKEWIESAKANDEELLKEKKYKKGFKKRKIR